MLTQSGETTFTWPPHDTMRCIMARHGIIGEGPFMVPVARRGDSGLALKCPEVECNGHGLTRIKYQHHPEGG